MTSAVHPHQQRRQAIIGSCLVLLAIISTACNASSTTISQVQPSEAATEAATAPPIADQEPTAVEEVETPAPTTAPTTEPPAEVATEPTPADEPEEAAPFTDVAPGTAEVRLIDAGAEPRTELRLQIAPTCAEILTIASSQELTQTINDTPVPSAGVVGNVMEMATSAVPVGDNYNIRSEVVAASASPDTPPALAAGLDTELAKLIGLVSTTTITDRGVLVPGSASVEGAEALGAFASVLDSLNQTQAPLPAEAVGVGARWETISVIDLDGLAVANITETELVSLDGTVIGLRVTGRQEVEIGAEFSAQGFSATVAAWSADTVGESVIDLATISPISSSARSVGLQQLDFGSGPDGGFLDQEIITEISISGAADDGCTGRTIRP